MRSPIKVGACEIYCLTVIGESANFKRKCVSRLIYCSFWHRDGVEISKKKNYFLIIATFMILISSLKINCSFFHHFFNRTHQTKMAYHFFLNINISHSQKQALFYFMCFVCLFFYLFLIIIFKKKGYRFARDTHTSSTLCNCCCACGAHTHTHFLRWPSCCCWMLLMDTHTEEERNWLLLLCSF